MSHPTDSVEGALLGFLDFYAKSVGEARLGRVCLDDSMGKSFYQRWLNQYRLRSVESLKIS